MEKDGKIYSNRKTGAEKMRETENREWETEKARYEWSHHTDTLI